MSPIDRRRFTLQGAGALLGAGLARPSRPADAPAPLAAPPDELARRMPRLMELANTPGVAVGVVERGRVSWTRGFGVRVAGATDAVDADTVFQAASLSKPVVAYAALRLVDEGRLDLDRPLAAYLGASPAPGDPRGAEVTPRHVLGHATGFVNWRTRADQTLSTAFAPGSRFGYSGEGYVLLQRVIERVTGTGFAAHLRDAVLAPLGMTRSSFLWLPVLEPNLAGGHSSRGAPAEPRSVRLAQQLHEAAARRGSPLVGWTYDESLAALAQLTPAPPALPVFVQPNAAGGLLTTANDYARFVERVATGTLSGLSAASHRLLATPVVRINSALAWGHGIGIEAAGDRTLLWHWGDNPGFKNFVLIEPARRAGVVIFTNGDNGLRLCDRALTVLTGEARDVFLWI